MSREREGLYGKSLSDPHHPVRSDWHHGTQAIAGLLAPCAFVGGSRLVLPQFLYAITDTEKDGGWGGLCNLVSRRNSAHRHHWDTVVQRADLSAQNWLFGSHHPRRYRLEPEWSWALK